MLTLANIRDWLAENNFIMASHYYTGKLDNKKEKSMGIYQLADKNPLKIALGGLSNTKTMEKSISILIHWSNNANETEIEANKLYNSLLTKKDFFINNIKINYIKLLVPEPVNVGTDESDIYERVIEATFYYERKEI